MNMLMIDLETLSLEQNAAIASIGLVAFNLDGVIEKKQIDVCIDSCQRAGLHISAGTVSWWMAQAKEAIDRTFNTKNRTCIKDALIETKKFYNDNVCGDVYGNGAVADLVWMKNAYKAVGVEPPWNYWNELCFRTARSLLPRVHDFEFSGVAHVAVDDAENQALYLIEAIKLCYD